DRNPSLAIDGALGPAAATPELAAEIARLGPFGSGNREPRFAVPAARVVRADPVGADHVRCVLAGGDGARLDAIAFRAFETGLGPALLQARGAALHVAGHLRAETWQGRRRVQLFIEDAAPAFG
ncbi:MAG TPA: single-stranded-DNA-specific exonuclease RecJ, partial [Dongiaceae bacterium]|nr:single-stranded-DNA-specific exonuclease RecJ [Dongiaceae bacterium]